MTALTKGRTVKSIPGNLFAYPVLADAVIHQGAIVVITAAGYAKPGVTGTALTTVGIARDPVDATGLANGAVIVEVDEMIASCVSAGGGDLITFDDIGKPCYLVDDQTVGLTSATDTRSLAGIIRKVEGGLVFVEFTNKTATLAAALA
jgi:hypothetical protein